MSRAFVNEDAGPPERRPTFDLPPRTDPGFDAAAARALLEGARAGDTAAAEDATGYRWGEAALHDLVARIADDADAGGDERLAQLARRFLRALVLTLCVGLSPLVGRAQRTQGAPTTAQAAATTIALTHAIVVDVERGTLQRDQVVVLRGDRIVQVGAARAVRLPAGTRTVDVAGGYVIPGLWDFHVHMALDSALRTPAAATRRAQAMQYWGGLSLAHGVTGVRDLAGDVPVLAQLDSLARTTTTPGPRMVYTGEKLGQAPVVAGAPFPVRTRDDVRASLTKLRGTRATFLKLAPMLDSTLVRSAYEACAAARVPCVSHVPHDVPRAALAQRGLASIEHLLLFPEYLSHQPRAHWKAIAEERAQPTWWQRVGYRLGLREPPEAETRLAQADFDEGAARALFAQMAANGVAVTPTLFLHDIMKRAGVRNGPARDTLLMLEWPTDGLRADRRTPAQRAAHQQDWAFLQRLVRLQRDAGVLLLAGTDLPLQGVPGLALHAELALLQDAGLTPVEALRAATLNPARWLQATDTLGTVQAGRVADLVVLRNDPLADVRNVASVALVVARGRLYDAAARAALVRDARAAREPLRPRAPLP